VLRRKVLALYAESLGDGIAPADRDALAAAVGALPASPPTEPPLARAVGDRALESAVPTPPPLPAMTREERIAATDELLSSSPAFAAALRAVGEVRRECDCTHLLRCSFFPTSIGVVVCI
jgi:hypothetical protein